MRRRPPQQAPHTDRWLISYADFITLLFAFFTTLYAISTVDQQKAHSLERAMAEALKLQLPAGALPDPAAVPSLRRASPPPSVSPTEASRLRALARELSHMAEGAELQGRVRVTTESRGVVISLAETGFFETGQAEVRSDATEALDLVAARVRAHDAREALQVTVEGHTDDRPVRGGRYRSNLELSTARATSVVQRFVTHGFSPARVAAAGYGEWRPVASNDSAEGRAHNRRVDLLLRLDEPGDPQ